MAEITSTNSELHQDEDELANIIHAVRQLVLGDIHLKCSTSDHFLTRFIKASNYDVQQSFHLIQEYFKAKIDYPDEFAFKLPSFYATTISRLELGYISSKVDNNGRKILILRLGNINPYQECWSHLIQAAVVTLEAVSLEPDFQNKGVNLILDCTNFSLKLMKWVTPHKIRAALKILQDCVPLRFDFVNIVNAPLVFNIFYSTIKPFMKEELLKKLGWHCRPFTSLHKFMDPSLIPKNLGGTVDDKEMKNWFEIVLNKEEIIKDNLWMGYV